MMESQESINKLQNTKGTGPRSYFDLLDLIKKHRAQPGLNVVPPGRPFYIAHIPMNTWELEELKLKYYDILGDLKYREAMAWCRGFNYSYTTYLMRRYRHRRPRLEEVILTVGWYDAGKPVQRKNRKSIASFLPDSRPPDV